MAGISVRVSSRVPAVIAQITAQAAAVVDAVSADIQTRAEAMAPRDTGSLAASIYRSNGTESDYNLRASRAQALNKDVVIVPEVDPEFVISTSGDNSSTFSTVVGPAAQHGLFQEFGTRNMRAQPFLMPAALGFSEDLITEMSKIANGV